jgi:HSP20 family protein
MAEYGTKKQRSEDQSTQTSPSTSQTGRQMERSRGSDAALDRPSRGGGFQRSSGVVPSFFSVSPGEFFTMSPITLLRRFTEDIDRAVGGLGTSRRGGTSVDDLTWMPAVDIRQSGNKLAVRVDLPGVEDRDVQVHVTDDGLVIQGEREQVASSDEGGIQVTERAYGRFYRLIPLPDNADTDQIVANINNGVLEITIPLAESESTRRQIPVGTSAQAASASSGSSASQQAQAASASSPGSSGSGQSSTTSGSGSSESRSKTAGSSS